MPLRYCPSLLLSLIILLAVSPETALADSVGTLQLDRNFVKTPDGVITVTLNDSDLNAPVLHEQELADADGNQYRQPASLGVGAILEVRVRNFSIYDTNGDNAVNFEDVTVSLPSLDIIGIRPSNGLVTMIVRTQVVTNTAFTLTYAGEGVQTHEVKVSSVADPAGFDLTLRETGLRTSVFEATFRTGFVTQTNFFGFDSAVNPDLTPRPTIAAALDDRITVTYDDADPVAVRNASALVDSSAPSISVVGPINLSFTNESSPLLVAEVTDAGEGIQSNNIFFNVIDVTTPAGDIVSGISSGGVRSFSIPDGFRVEATLLGFPAAGEVVVRWNVEAHDKAGNIAFSDQDPQTTTQNDYYFTVDTIPPSFASPNGAITGQFWDQESGLIVTDPTKVDDTSVRVLFNDDLDGATIRPEYFSVDGTAPITANWFAESPSDVFLTVPLMLSNARPRIEVVGPVQDKSGNRVQGQIFVVAADGIAPRLRVESNMLLSPGDDGRRAITNRPVTVRVISDEPSVNPISASLQVRRVLGSSILEQQLVPTRFELIREGHEWEWQFQLEGGLKMGLYNLYLPVQDRNGNVGFVGTHIENAVGEPRDDQTTLDDPRIALFEFDVSIPPPRISVNNPGLINASLVVDFVNEGREYGVLSNGGFSVPQFFPFVPTGFDDVNPSYDTHPNLELLSARLDGRDILNEVTTMDGVRFMYVPKNLSAGTHRLDLTVRDEVGNEVDFSIDVTEALKKVPVVTPTATATATPLPMPTATNTATPMPTETPTVVPSTTPRATATNTPVPTVTPTHTPTPTLTPSPTSTATPTQTPPPSPTATPTGTPTPSPTGTPVPAATVSPTAVPAPTQTPSPTATLVPTLTPMPSPTQVLDPTATPTVVPLPTTIPSGGFCSTTGGGHVDAGVLLIGLVGVALVGRHRRKSTIIE